MGSQVRAKKLEPERPKKQEKGLNSISISSEINKTKKDISQKMGKKEFFYLTKSSKVQKWFSSWMMMSSNIVSVEVLKQYFLITLVALYSLALPFWFE